MYLYVDPKIYNQSTLSEWHWVFKSIESSYIKHFYLLMSRSSKLQLEYIEWMVYWGFESIDLGKEFCRKYTHDWQCIITRNLCSIVSSRENDLWNVFPLLHTNVCIYIKYFFLIKKGFRPFISGHTWMGHISKKGIDDHLIK